MKYEMEPQGPETETRRRFEAWSRKSELLGTSSQPISKAESGFCAASLGPKRP